MFLIGRITRRRTTQNNMVACGTDTFAVRDFVHTGRVLRVVADALILLFSATCWSCLGYI